MDADMETPTPTSAPTQTTQGNGPPGATISRPRLCPVACNAFFPRLHSAACNAFFPRLRPTGYNAFFPRLHLAGSHAFCSASTGRPAFSPRDGEAGTAPEGEGTATEMEGPTLDLEGPALDLEGQQGRAQVQRGTEVSSVLSLLSLLFSLCMFMCCACFISCRLRQPHSSDCALQPTHPRLPHHRRWRCRGLAGCVWELPWRPPQGKCILFLFFLFIFFFAGCGGCLVVTAHPGRPPTRLPRHRWRWCTGTSWVCVGAALAAAASPPFFPKSLPFNLHVVVVVVHVSFPVGSGGCLAATAHPGCPSHNCPVTDGGSAGGWLGVCGSCHGGRQKVNAHLESTTILYTLCTTQMIYLQYLFTVNIVTIVLVTKM